jgi:nickel/cobalt transporter (NicO) family protein
MPVKGTCLGDVSCFSGYCLPMRWLKWFLPVASLFLASPAWAHPLDVAYFDFSKSSSTIELTVAVHPYQAFQLIRGDKNIPFDLKKLQENGELIAAYVGAHTELASGGGLCDWLVDTAHTPPTELEAVADGVTVTGPVTCHTTPSALVLKTNLFVDAFPGQNNIVRLELPDGFAERTTLTRERDQYEINLGDLASTASSSTTTSTTPIHSLNDYATLAKKLLDPNLGFWSWVILLGSALFIGSLHALGPGHGKSLMAAVLVGEKATIKNALILGTVMTLTHVSDVLALAFLAGFISTFLPPTQLLHWLEILSAAGLLVFGLFNLSRAIIRYRLARNNPEASESEDAHERAHLLGVPHSHGAAEDEPHDHPLPPDRSFKRALWMGFVGSLAPCPTAWAIFMATLSIGKALAGLGLLVAFTIGLHLTILIIGSLVVLSKNFALKRTPPGFTYALPIISALAVVGLGVYLFVRLV